MKSPLLATPGAVPADGPDSGVAAHYGDPYAEQRALAGSAGLVDRSHRGVIRITGPDRLSWLHSLTTQSLDKLAAGDTAEALILSPNGHVEHQLTLTDDGTAVWAHVEPGTAGPLLEFLESMRFMLRVEPADVSGDYAVLTVMARRPRVRRMAAGGNAAGCVSNRFCRCPPAAGRRERRAAGRRRGAGGHVGTRRCGSRRTGRGSGWTPITGRSRTRSAGSRPRCTSARAATAARRRSRGCTTSAIRRGGWCSCTWTGAMTCCQAMATRWSWTAPGSGSSDRRPGTTSSARSRWR